MLDQVVLYKLFKSYIVKLNLEGVFYTQTTGINLELRKHTASASESGFSFPV